jgi:hypothetical protein
MCLVEMKRYSSRRPRGGQWRHGEAAVVLACTLAGLVPGGPPPRAKKDALIRLTSVSPKVSQDPGSPRRASHTFRKWPKP